jgi:glycosyltransferase involved in cell wall biosynthesis
MLKRVGFCQTLEQRVEKTIGVFWKTFIPYRKMTEEAMPTSCDSTMALTNVEIGLLTGCQDRHYAFALAMALTSKGLRLDVIGSDEVDSPDMHTTPKLNFLNLGGRQRQNACLTAKVWRLLSYYAKLIRYATVANPKIFHILWNNKFEYFDRTLLMLYYRALGKKIALTAHNINQGRRDSNDSLLNRLTLRVQYRLADHIFVHTRKMKNELLENFGVHERAVTVIRYPINNAFPDTDLTPAEAKRRLGISDAERTIVFFGRIRPYKGLEHLLAAYQKLLASNLKYRLIIAGEPKKGSEDYLDEMRRVISRDFNREQIILKIQFIPDEEIELYLKAADVLALPYNEIFQSGVLFLGYSFGLPVVATDVGSFRDDIIEGRTGFLCSPGDPVDLAVTIERYFESDLYNDLKNRRQEIRDYANAQHSWNAVGEITRDVYAELLGHPA